MTFTASYSPDDNKLRLRASERLDPDTYARVKAAGFSWAPRQELFVAPKWTPEREDLLLELAGEIGDEDTSLVDRAEVRAERFDTYREKRTADAEGARRAVAAITDHIPLGQPILVGHHSERRARRDAERIEDGIRKSIKMWDTATYWRRRAAGALHHAKYKQRPDVRAGRIKTIEADQRREQKAVKEAETFLRLWRQAHDDNSAKKKDGSPTTSAERALYLANYDHGVPSGTWSDLRDGKTTPAEAQALAIAAHERRIARAHRWIAHCVNRLDYERAMLAESGGWVPPPKPKTKADLPLLNYAGEVATRNQYHAGEIERGVAVGITKAEWAAIHNDYKGTALSEDGTHRVRTAMHVHGNRGISYVYLTDSKQHPKPTPAEVSQSRVEEQDAAEARRAEKLARLPVELTCCSCAGPAGRWRQHANRDKGFGICRPCLDRERPTPVGVASRYGVEGVNFAPPAAAAAFEALRQTAEAGVRVVTVDQLVPTPDGVAARMVELARIQPGHRVLEPSAGTGSILRAISLLTTGLRQAYGDREPTIEVRAVEIDRELARLLPAHFHHDVAVGDFLEMVAADLGGRFDRILMNPPFAKGADIAHILHAIELLKPTGRVVAICADGPRQRKELAPRAASWDPLPADTFDGVSVRAALATFGAGGEP